MRQAPLPLQAPLQMPKLRLLCLHSYRTSAAIFKQQMKRGGLHDTLADLADMVRTATMTSSAGLLARGVDRVVSGIGATQDYLDAPIPATGPPMDDVLPYFEPPFFQWWSADTVR